MPVDVEIRYLLCPNHLAEMLAIVAAIQSAEHGIETLARITQRKGSTVKNILQPFLSHQVCIGLNSVMIREIAVEGLTDFVLLIVTMAECGKQSCVQVPVLRNPLRKEQLKIILVVI